jgi:PadR family transcriptional regulator PadR
MAKRDEEKERLALLQGTLDVLIMRVLLFGPQHGQGIGRAIHQVSGQELIVDHGALYPALQRLEERNLITAEWGVSTNNRRARFYTLSKAGRHALARETSKWQRMSSAVGRVLSYEF